MACSLEEKHSVFRDFLFYRDRRFPFSKVLIFRKNNSGVSKETRSSPSSSVSCHAGPVFRDHVLPLCRCSVHDPSLVRKRNHSSSLVDVIPPQESKNSLRKKVAAKLKLYREGICRVGKMLTDVQRTRFVVVCIAEFLSVSESQRLLGELKRCGVKCSHVVVNQLVRDYLSQNDIAELEALAEVGGGVFGSVERRVRREKGGSVERRVELKEGGSVERRFFGRERRENFRAPPTECVRSKNHPSAISSGVFVVILWVFLYALFSLPEHTDHNPSSSTPPSMCMSTSVCQRAEQMDRPTITINTTFSSTLLSTFSSTLLSFFGRERREKGGTKSRVYASISKK